MIRHLKNKKGLTLVELVVTIGILAIVIIPISSLFVSSAKANTMSKTELEAISVAQSCMETIKAARSLNDIKISDGNWTVEDEDTYKPYKVEYTLSRITDEEGKSLYEKTEVVESGTVSDVAFNIDLDTNDERNFIINCDNNFLSINGSTQNINLLNKDDVNITVNSKEYETITVTNELSISVKIYNLDGNVTVETKKGKVETIRRADYADIEAVTEDLIYKVNVKVFNSSGKLVAVIDGTKLFE